METTKFDQLLNHYSESHQNKINKTIHWVAVPSIVFSFLCLIWSIPVPAYITDITPFFNWATPVIAFALYYYWNLSKPMSIAMAFVIFGFSLLIVQIEQAGLPLWQVALIVFFVAWVFQFIGHKIEGAKPSFLEDIQYLLIGPVWLLHFIFKKVGLPYNG